MEPASREAPLSGVLPARVRFGSADPYVVQSVRPPGSCAVSVPGPLSSSCCNQADAAQLGKDAVEIATDGVKAAQVGETAARGASPIDHAAAAGAKLIKAAKAVSPVAAAAPGAISAVTDAVHGDRTGAAVSAVSAIPFGHLPAWRRCAEPPRRSQRTVGRPSGTATRSMDFQM